MRGNLLIYISKMTTPGRLHFSYDLYRRYIYFAELENDTLNQAEFNESKN